MSTEKLVVGATLLLQDCPVCSDKLSCGSVKIDSPYCEMSPVLLHKVLELLDGTTIIRLIDYPTDDSPRNSSGMVASCWYCGGRSLPLYTVVDWAMAMIQDRPVWVRITHASHASQG
jgi:hypothetical protein